MRSHKFYTLACLVMLSIRVISVLVEGVRAFSTPIAFAIWTLQKWCVQALTRSALRRSADPLSIFVTDSLRTLSARTLNSPSSHLPCATSDAPKSVHPRTWVFVRGSLNLGGGSVGKSSWEPVSYWMLHITLLLCRCSPALSTYFRFLFFLQVCLINWALHYASCVCKSYCLLLMNWRQFVLLAWPWSRLLFIELFSKSVSDACFVWQYHPTWDMWFYLINCAVGEKWRKNCYKNTS